jgi:hypothetical protein
MVRACGNSRFHFRFQRQAGFQGRAAPVAAVVAAGAGVGIARSRQEDGTGAPASGVRPRAPLPSIKEEAAHNQRRPSKGA